MCDLPKGGTLEEVKPEYLATWGPGIYHNSPHPSVASYCFGDEIQNLSQTCKAPGHILWPTLPSFICHLSIPHCLHSTLLFFPSFTTYPLFQNPWPCWSLCLFCYLSSSPPFIPLFLFISAQPPLFQGSLPRISRLDQVLLSYPCMEWHSFPSEHLLTWALNYQSISVTRWWMWSSLSWLWVPWE